MTETDDIGDAEAFNDIERQAKQRKESVRAAMLREEDDDIQVYQRPWVWLTDEEIEQLAATHLFQNVPSHLTFAAIFAIQAKLKEKNT